MAIGGMAACWRLLLVVLVMLERPFPVVGGYKLRSLTESNKGIIVADLEISNRTSNYGPDIGQLRVTVSYETDDLVRVHITDPTTPRWEVPSSLIPRSHHAGKHIQIMNGEEEAHPLEFSCTVEPFTFAIVRKSTGEALFNSTPALTFKDQYLEIATGIPAHASLYGLGESTRPAGFRLSPNSTYTLWAADIPSEETDRNLYGSFPFYLDVREAGVSHGVLLLNSNGMDVSYQGDRLTYRILGGVLDFYFFAGPSPISVVQQLTELVGKPAPMPYWSLGFHQCRYGYKNVEELESVVASYRSAGIPLEVMWTDIDYMDVFRDFTLDPVNFPKSKMQAFLKQLHANSQRYVTILDPGIKPDSNYTAYERGKALDIFIKDSSGKPYLGQVWPGPVHFPDFLHPRAESYWTREIADFHETIPFDGLWIDMNEVSNFCSGINCSLPANGHCPAPDAFTTCCLICSENAPSKWDSPAFLINNDATRRLIGAKTIATSATHYGGIREYDAHNLYGLSEAIATHKALRSVTRKRPFILTRSTFLGSGRVAAHWSGDNGATWADLRYSLVSILNSGLAGIPMVGADICGFLGNTTEELCNRWIQVGAFYPFSRNHNDINGLPQELYRWKSVTESAKKVLSLRYRLLPHLYTLFYEAHTNGSPVARPVFFAFPGDSRALAIDSQFMLGESILVSPVLSSGARSVEAYFPQGSWYNLFDFSQVIASPGASYRLPTPSDSTNVHLHEGSIVAMQQDAMTTTLARKTPFTLITAFSKTTDGRQTASGRIFLDNGEDLEMELKKGSSTLVEFTAKRLGARVSITSRVKFGEFALKEGWIVEKVVVLGGFGSSAQQQELVNGKAALPVSFPSTTDGKHIQEFVGLNLPLGESFHILLKMASYE